MVNRINKIIDKTSDKMFLEALKLDVTNEKSNIIEVINRYISLYDEMESETINYDISLGYDRTLKDLKRVYNKLKPYSDPINYREINIKAKGDWKDIYEISFGSPTVTITTKKTADEKTRQMKFKEAA